MISILIPRGLNNEEPDSMNDTFPSIVPIGGRIIKIIKIIRNNQGDNFMANNIDELTMDELDALEQELPEDIDSYVDENEAELDDIPDEEEELDEYPATDALDPDDAETVDEEEVDEFTNKDGEEDVDASELDEEDDFEGLDG